MARRHVAALITALTLAGGAAAGLAWYDRFMARVLPAVDRVDISSLFVDDAPVRVTLAGGGSDAVWDTTAHEVRSSPALWRRMHVANWNRVPPALRRDGLDGMLRHYQSLLANPSRWDRMRTADWDEVPQPVRIVAYRAMVAYWTGYYRLGRGYGLRPDLVTDMLAAIVMSESWFEHRARFVNRDGTVDVGLGMASDYARRRLRALEAAGAVDASFTDAEYLNPWVGTRFAALWFSLLLDEARGDLLVAVRAYNRGINDAHDATGTAYLSAVQRRLGRFIHNRNAPPAWDYLWQRSRAIERAAWPWTQRTSPDGQAQERSRVATTARFGTAGARPPARASNRPCCL